MGLPKILQSGKKKHNKNKKIIPGSPTSKKKSTIKAPGMPLAALAFHLYISKIANLHPKNSKIILIL